MLWRVWVGVFLVWPALALGQFVYPRPGYHEHDPNVYKEDPFVVHYRHEFFSVFSGDFGRFEQAFGEIKAMVAKNPSDARALVWMGNGDTVEAGVLWATGKKDESLALIQESRPLLDKAVALRPDDPNIFMMRAVTLYIQGQNWPEADIPRSNWEELRYDCGHLIRLMGPKMARASVHVRGETYGEMGVADLKLGDTAGARQAFWKVIELCPATDYEARARKELQPLMRK